MKKSLFAVVAACGMLVGCHSLPTPEKMESISRLVGVSAGIVSNASSMDALTRSTVIGVVMKIAERIPATNETVASVWIPVARDHVTRLVSAGSLTQDGGSLVMYAISLACDGMDYLIEIRYPKVREYEDLTRATIRGFTSGFLSVFSSPDSVETMMQGARRMDYDTDALHYLMKKSIETVKQL